MFLGSKDTGRYQAPQESKELITGLRFLYENYRTETWYWEVIEMMRKVSELEVDKGRHTLEFMFQGHVAGTNPLVCTAQDACCRDSTQAGAHEAN